MNFWKSKEEQGGAKEKLMFACYAELWERSATHSQTSAWFNNQNHLFLPQIFFGLMIDSAEKEVLLLVYHSDNNVDNAIILELPTKQATCPQVTLKTNLYVTFKISETFINEIGTQNSSYISEVLKTIVP